MIYHSIDQVCVFLFLSFHLLPSCHQIYPCTPILGSFNYRIYVGEDILLDCIYHPTSRSQISCSLLYHLPKFLILNLIQIYLYYNLQLPLLSYRFHYQSPLLSNTTSFSPIILGVHDLDILP